MPPRENVYGPSQYMGPGDAPIQPYPSPGVGTHNPVQPAPTPAPQPGYNPNPAAPNVPQPAPAPNGTPYTTPRAAEGNRYGINGNLQQPQPQPQVQPQTQYAPHARYPAPQAQPNIPANQQPNAQSMPAPITQPRRATVYEDISQASQPNVPNQPAPQTPVVQMPDGTQVPVEQYLQPQLAEVEKAKQQNADRALELHEWDKVLKGGNAQDGKGDGEPETPKPLFEPIKVDGDTFTSDGETQIAEKLNETGTAVNQIAQSVHSEVADLKSKIQEVVTSTEKMEQMQREQVVDREIEIVCTKYGITPEEIIDAAKETGNTQNIDALGELVRYRKDITGYNQHVVNQGIDQRAQQASYINVAPGAHAAGRPAQPERAQTVDPYDPISITNHYRAFTG